MSTDLWTSDDRLKNSSPPPTAFFAMHSAVRQVSGTAPTITMSSPSSSPNGSNNNSWRATNTVNATTKSSQMIERIMAENDRLKRECLTERTQREEAVKRLAAEKSIIEQIRAENSQLQILHDANERAIERKDRKIRELQNSLDSEKNRRVSAEKHEEEMGTELGRSLAESKELIAKANAAQWQAETQANALSDGIKRRDIKLTRQIDQMAKDLEGLQKSRKEDQSKLMRLEIISSQKHQESARLNDLATKMEALMSEYEEEKTNLMKQLEEEASDMKEEVVSNAQKITDISDEMLEVTKKMKWLMAVKENLREP